MRPQNIATLLVAILAVTACADESAPTAISARPTEAALAATGSGPRIGFGFNGTAGVVILTGGGSFDPTSASNVADTDTRAAAGGGFRCTENVTGGPLLNCAAGEGVRWDGVQLLASTNFRCSGTDILRSATTSDRTAILLADFYRAGDGNKESFRAPMIVSEDDIALDLPGVQNLWIQGVGCGAAIVNFSRTLL
jgi:hypothetical protein